MILDTLQQQAHTLYEGSNSSLLLCTAVSILLLTYALRIVLPGLRLKRKLAHFPVINKLEGEFSNKNAVERCSKNAGVILREGYEKVRERVVDHILDVKDGWLTANRSMAGPSRSLDRSAPDSFYPLPWRTGSSRILASMRWMLSRRAWRRTCLGSKA